MNVKECTNDYVGYGLKRRHWCCLPTGDDHTIHKCIPECGAEWNDDRTYFKTGTGEGFVARWNQLSLLEREELYPGYNERISQQEALNDETADTVSRDGFPFGNKS